MLFLWLVCTVISANAAPLALFCEVNGRPYPVAKVERHQIWVMVEGKLTPAPRDANWRLEGDLKENARYADWSPSYKVSRLDMPDYKVATTPVQLEARVWVRHWIKGAHIEFGGRMMRMDFAGPFVDVWPEGLTTPGAVVMAWVLHGQVVKAEAQPVPSMSQAQDFWADISWDLTPDEAMGQPVALLWHEGAFVPVRPRFAKPEGEAAFHAVEMHDLAALQAALHAGLKPGIEDRKNVSLFYYAAEAGNLGAVEMLLAAGVSPNSDQRKFNIPLSAAVSGNRQAVVDRLLAAKANPNGGTRGLWPLAVALNQRLNGIALSLVAAKARLNDTDIVGHEPVIVAMDLGMADVASAMIEGKAYQDADKDQAARVLITQAKKGHTAVVRLLLQQKIKPDLEFQDGTALIMGASSGDPELAKALIAAGASPNQAVAGGLTPLIAAAVKGQADYAVALLDAGANPDATTADGWTALHFAAQERATAVVALLLARGAKADVAAKDGLTPLHIALNVQAREAADAIVAKGAKPDLQSPDFMETAITIDAKAVVQAALAAGWSCDTVFRGGWPALRVAIEAGAPASASLLRTAGAKETAGGPTMASSGKLDAKIRLLKGVPPEDPRDPEDDDLPARTVEADIVIDPSGEVRFPRVVGAPEPALAIETLRVLRQWRFAAPLSQQSPVAIRARVPVTFAASADLAKDMSEVDREPETLKMVSPDTPPSMRWGDFSGVVWLRFIVTPEGRVTHIRVKGAQHPEFARAAVEAVAQWTFKPAVLDGRPVAVWMNRSVLFRR
ncbi:MAG: TonB family protein [Verrucomicrobia bacterium]|nr:TonB family protein [Verrucomicrobiota bacterium]